MKRKIGAGFGTETVKQPGGSPWMWLAIALVAFIVGGKFPNVMDVLPIPSWVKPVASAPFACDGLHVLIVEEGSERNTITKEQLYAIESSKIPLKIREVGIKLSDGSYSLRIWDKDKEDSSKVEPVWKGAFEAWRSRSNGKTPWLLISNGKSGVSKELVSEDDTLTLMEKFKK